MDKFGQKKRIKFFSEKFKIGGFFILDFSFSIAVLALILFAIFNIKAASAATSTIRGAAWLGDVYKYVYFNCADDVIGDLLDVEGNLWGSGKYPPPEDKFHFYSPPCSGLIHGVYLDNTNGNLSGDAWNAVLDLISFDSTTAPPDLAYTAACPSCSYVSGCTACWDELSQNIYGWARVKKDGTWVRFDSGLTPPVRLQSWNLATPVWPSGTLEPGDFVGTASYALNNLSLNCETELNGASNCATRNYKVYNTSLQIGRLSAPNWSEVEACSAAGALNAYLKWDIKSGVGLSPARGQTAYEIVVSENNVLSTSTGAYTCWSGKKSSTIARQYPIPNSDPNCSAGLDYNTSYYWWIRLFDQNDVPTEWYQFGVNDGHLGTLDVHTNRLPDPDPKVFKTYLHEFPSPYFSMNPADPEIGSTTVFTSFSKFYTTAAPSTPQDCNNLSCAYLWTVVPMSPIPPIISSTTVANPTMTFATPSTTTITLRVTDKTDGYYCSTSTTLMINYGLPLWREIKAEQMP